MGVGGVWGSFTHKANNNIYMHVCMILFRSMDDVIQGGDIQILFICMCDIIHVYVSYYIFQGWGDIVLAFT